jgi:hypothetical protein
MAIETAYFHASGVAYGNCTFIGQRFDGERGYRPGTSECWMMQAAGQPDGSFVVTHQYGTQRWFTGLWRSLEGTTYVSDGTVKFITTPTRGPTIPTSDGRGTI